MDMSGFSAINKQPQLNAAESPPAVCLEAASVPPGSPLGAASPHIAALRQRARLKKLASHQD